MLRKINFAELLVKAAVGGVCGLVLGFLFGSDLVDLLPSRFSRWRPGRAVAYWQDSAAHHIKNDIIWLSLGGFVLGAAFGAGYEVVRAIREARKSSGSPAKNSFRFEGEQRDGR